MAFREKGWPAADVHLARGTEQMGGAYGILGMTALGRQEEWELPKGRGDHATNPSFG
ncbi:DUF899 domain-containing protein [Actinoplanes sp. KI2]|nr:DUF899 domain-containing protein [Actinoplanes sp. KI2]MCU7726038.1 DUF899 domain-containing protein [Actinoplanes sp. KI2]